MLLAGIALQVVRFIFTPLPRYCRTVRPLHAQNTSSSVADSVSDCVHALPGGSRRTVPLRRRCADIIAAFYGSTCTRSAMGFDPALGLVDSGPSATLIDSVPTRFQRQFLRPWILPWVDNAIRSVSSSAFQILRERKIVMLNSRLKREFRSTPSWRLAGSRPVIGSPKTECRARAHQGPALDRYTPPLYSCQPDAWSRSSLTRRNSSSARDRALAPRVRVQIAGLKSQQPD